MLFFSCGGKENFCVEICTIITVQSTPSSEIPNISIIIDSYWRSEYQYRIFILCRIYSGIRIATLSSRRCPKCPSKISTTDSIHSPNLFVMGATSNLNKRGGWWVQIKKSTTKYPTAVNLLEQLDISLEDMTTHYTDSWTGQIGALLLLISFDPLGRSV